VIGNYININKLYLIFKVKLFTVFCHLENSEKSYVSNKKYFKAVNKELNYINVIKISAFFGITIINNYVNIILFRKVFYAKFYIT
jgi:hypothetical protein